MSARGFVWRWSWRTVRNEWRQYIVILVMITTGVATATAAVVVTYNIVQPPDSVYGTGQIAIDSPTPDALARELRAADIDYGVVQRGTIQQDGRRGTIELRAADPANAVTESLFSLREGRWPANENEVGVTDRALADQPSIGAMIELDGRTVEVVGVVENPDQLSEEFVFALAPSSFESVQAPTATQFMVDASVDEAFNTVTVDIGVSERTGPSDRTVTSIVVNVIVALGMVEIALLVGSAFSVIARRRTRQYGLLASAGATPSMVRSAATSTGAIIGFAGTAIGLVVGLAVARGFAPTLEPSIDRRVDFELPTFALIPTVVLGIGVAAFGARRPTKGLTRSSIASLLSAARPHAEPVGRAAVGGVVLAGAGIAALVGGFQNEDGMLAVLGTVIAPIGLLLLAPLLVKLLGHGSRHLPLAERLAGRSIARYNRRSASAVAALALALAVPVGIAVVTTSIDQRAESRPPNLADNQLIVWAPDVSTESAIVPAVDEEALSQAVDVLAEAAPELTFVPLQVTLADPDTTHVGDDGVSYRFPLLAGEQLIGDPCNFCAVDTIGWGDSEFVVSAAYVATPELLDAMGLDDEWIDGGKTAIADQAGLQLLDDSADNTKDAVLTSADQVAVSESWPGARSLPRMLHVPEVGSGGVTTVGWLAVGDGPLDETTIAAVTETSLHSVELELPEPPGTRSTLRTVGLAIGVLVGIGITAAAVLLLTSELARDSALLASLGADPAAGRRISASIAGMLALIGAVLAVLIGYLPLTPMVSAKVDDFPFVVPWLTLLALLIGFPAVASGLGWLLSGKTSDGRDLRDFI